MERFEELRVEAIVIMREARRRGDNRLALAALNAAQELDVKSGKTLGHMAADGQVFIDARRQTIEAFGQLSVEELRRIAALGEVGALPVPPEAVEADVINVAVEVPVEPPTAT